jgi:hypothetical protein
MTKKTVNKLGGKITVITGGNSGIGLTTAKNSPQRVLMSISLGKIQLPASFQNVPFY